MPTPYKLIHGDCLDVLRSMESDSVDAIVTDPPYGLSFMGKKWDYQVPSTEVWKECLRVLRPGGHALIACGTRTQHRMAVNIEDAGFEIRDVITWLYGSGFPKSLDVSKAIDKAAGAEREVVGKKPYKLRKSDNGIAENSYGVLGGFGPGEYIDGEITAPSTEAARTWAGWGTALKPACEFWTLARRPLSEPTVAKNVLRHGTGGINVDGCRVGTTVETWPKSRSYKSGNVRNRELDNSDAQTEATGAPPPGRFPANLILDEVAAGLLDEQTGELKSGARTGPNKTHSLSGEGAAKYGRYDHTGGPCEASSGGASRFFYVAKASKSERNLGCEGMEEREATDFKGKRLECVNCGKRTMIGSTFACGCGSPDPQWLEETRQHRAGNTNHHPTVKPVKLMRYLCRLITPHGGLVLDPFMGSGSTGVAALAESLTFTGIEREADYIAIASARLQSAID